ncbi:Putrescine-binding periplasmic protein SpuD [compost metagenome]
MDAKHPEYAYTFINFVMRPENMAAISNFTGYPTSNAKARPDVDPQMRNNPDIYPPEATFERLVTGKDIPQSDMRARMRVWTKFKTAPGS